VLGNAVLGLATLMLIANQQGDGSSSGVSEHPLPPATGGPPPGTTGKSRLPLRPTPPKPPTAADPGDPSGTSGAAPGSPGRSGSDPDRK
jgi:hypothetical protein